MARRAVPVALLGFFALAQSAQSFAKSPPSEDSWFSTFSIIAFDPSTGELGVGVQSRAFGAGAAVPWAEAGVGAVATQARANRLYGPKAMSLLKEGLSPSEVVKRITDEDPERERRQVAVIDTRGRSAVYTGRHVIDRNHDPEDLVHFGGYAGHIAGESYSVQGNTLASVAVLEAMARAYENGTGSLAERLMDALDAGQSEGGDTRGMQSAGLLVVRPIPPGSDSTVERVVDVRVDDAENPFLELRRLMNIALRVPNALAERASELAAAGRLRDAIETQKEALAIHPRSDELSYGLARLHAQAGEYSSALAPLEKAIALQPHVFKPRAEADPAFAPMKDLVEFKRLVSR